MSMQTHRCWCLVIMVLAVPFCLSEVWGQGVGPARHSHEIPEITPEMFFQPLPYRADVVLDAGALGRYRFSEDRSTHSVPENVTIRRELVALLNTLQEEFGHTILLISGYRSQQHQIYLWAKWLEGDPAKRTGLNSQGYKSWARWVAQSQSMLVSGWHPLTSKHQTGDAVSFYWKGLVFDTEGAQQRLTERIRELGGSRQYTADEREEFNIPADDDALFKVTAYRKGEEVSLENPSGRAYLHVEYQPSPVPERPEASRIGRRVESPPAHQHIYEEDDIVFVEVEGYSYLAKVMEDADATNTTLDIWLYVDATRKELGTEISVNRVLGRREEPKEGWGEKKVALEYFDRETWTFSWDAERFADHYRVAIGDRKRRLAFDQVRYPIPIRRHKQPGPR